MTAVATVRKSSVQKEFGTETIIEIKECKKNKQLKQTRLKLIDKRKNIFEIGDIIEITGEYEKINSYKNHGVFNYEKYLKKEKIYGKIQATKIEKMKSEKKIITIPKKFQEKAKNKFKKIFSEKTANYFNAIILGDKTELDKEIKNNFQTGGLSHLLAISGMHINTIIIIITYITSKTIKNIKIRKILLIIILIIYGLIIEFTPSATRAIVMSIIHIIATLLFKKDNFLINISIASLMLLMINPYYLIDTGYILSFTATISIIYIYPKLNKKISNIKLIQKIIDSIELSISANILIIPIIIYMFKKVPLSMIIIGTIISPFIFIIEILGIMVLITPEIILKSVKEIIEKFISIFDFISSIHFFIIYFKVPTTSQIIMYYAIVINYINIAKRKIQKKIIKLVIILSIAIQLIQIITIYISNDFIINLIDVGQGDSTLIITSEKRKILIDGGGNENYDVGENVLIPYLLNKRIKKIDYLIISHFDTDHIGGTLKVIEKLQVKKIIISMQKEKTNNFEEFLKLINKRKNEVIIVKAGDSIQVDKSTRIDILWPTEKLEITENSINNNSIVAKVITKDTSILFTGDIEKVAEKALVEKYGHNLQASILKVAHHGSKTSTIPEFLDNVNPQMALIGVGYNNNFGHPSITTIQNFKKRNIEIFRTDKCGEINIRINKKRKKVKKYEA